MVSVACMFVYTYEVPGGRMLNKIGKYEVSEQIGVGGFGAVYRGRDPFIKRTVAIKTCQVNDEEIKHRFFREAELAGNLHHRNITTIYDFGVENGIPYIVQEFLTGEDLDKVIKRGEPIPLTRKLEILMAIADGLGYAHNASIVHRDVKPANIRVLEDGTVKVMDFGIAKSMQTESNLTQTGITLGTSAYLAPEQIRGEAIDRRTDVFAMGVLSYELLTYRKPFRGEHLSTVLYKILNETPEPIEALAQDVPPGLATAVKGAMAKVPAERYPTMEAFRKDLQVIYRELSGHSGQHAGTSALAQTVRTIRPESDDDTTLATPSSGVSPVTISPPSGALARVPVPSDVTPTSASLAASGARPNLELVNFRDPAAEGAEEPAAGPRRTTDTDADTGVGRTRMVLFASLLGAIAVAVGAYVVLHRPAPAVPKAVPPPAAAVPTPALEFPEPKLGQGEPAPVPTAAPPAASASVAPPVAPAAPAAPSRFKVQFSSVPVATLSVDGKEIGPSIPARTLSLDEGEHRVRFDAKGFPPYEKTIRVGAKSEPRVHYQFPVSMLVIDARGWAGARVLVDGKYKGTLPDAARLRLPAGSYNLTLSREGANPVTEKIDVPEGAPKTWSPPPPVPAGPGGNS
jgi:serine/threonine-protein kinase